MKVSVIIPTYNRSKVVCDAIDSVLAQTYQDFELIIVDDGSTDDTKEKLKPYLIDERIRYEWQENAGVSAARNKGVTLSNGGMISFLDSDDLWKVDKLELEVGFLKKHLDVSVVFSDTEVYSGDSFNPSWLKSRPIFSKFLSGLSVADGGVLRQRDISLYLIEEFPVKGCNFSLTRQAFLRAGIFDHSFMAAEDWEFFIRLGLTENFGYIDQVLVMARESKDSLNHKEKESSYLSMLDFLSNLRMKLADDPQMQAVINMSISNISRQLNWYYLEKGSRLEAFKICLNGYRKTSNLEMLLRAGVLCLPTGIVGKVRNALRGVNIF